MGIVYEKRNQIAYITLSNPDKANILDRATSDEISEAWIDVWEDRDIRCAIITGEANASTELFTEREHFHALYQGVRNKAEAIEQFCSEFGLERDELACVFDDINDLGMVSGCAVRILVRRSSSALLQELAVREGLCDYLTASEADAHAVREAAEMLLGLMGAFDAVVQSRTAVDDDYRRYFAARQAIATTAR